MEISEHLQESKTHALLPAQIVPYSQILLNDHISICINHLNNESQTNVMNNNLLIDETNVSHIIRNFRKYWKQRLIAYSISLNQEISVFIKECFQHCFRQFMQIKRTVNILYDCTHIT